MSVCVGLAESGGLRPPHSRAIKRAAKAGRRARSQMDRRAIVPENEIAAFPFVAILETLLFLMKEEKVEQRCAFLFRQLGNTRREPFADK